MKKLITLGFFALTLFVGTQNTFAQDEKLKNIEETVKGYTVELQKTFSLDDNQTAVLQRALISKEKGYYKLANNSSENINKAQVNQRIDNQYKKVVLKVISEDTFSKINTWLQNAN